MCLLVPAFQLGLCASCDVTDPNTHKVAIAVLSSVRFFRKLSIYGNPEGKSYA